jgi:hypothetical protein
MEATSELLAYLHDARLLAVMVDFADAERTLTVTAKYDTDCGLPSMAGKTVVLVATEITLIRAEVYGALTEVETVDRCDLSVTREAADLLTSAIQSGIRTPRSRLSLVAHSGSIWEVMCETLTLTLA